MHKIIALLVCCVWITAAGSAQAYVGPGLGLGAIGAILGLILSVILAVVAIFWYPLKRMFKKKSSRKSEKEA